MPLTLSSEYVGRESRPLRLTVTARQIMNYAFAVDDPNPWYLDDTRPEGIVAPPMLATALTWKISENFTHYWDSAGFPAEVLARQVHYSEHIQWNRCMVPGDELEITGRVQAIVPHRAGTHLVMEYTARDRDSNVVFVESIGGLLRGVRCADEGRGDVGIFPETPDPAATPPAWARVCYIDPWAPFRYDAGADIHFPIHTSPAFARSVGLPGIIYHGAATLSIALRELVNREAGGDPRRLKSAACLFTAMVRPASLITIQAFPGVQSGASVSFGFAVLNQQQKQAVSRASAVIAGT
ncbi:MAG TPA: MaoC/PaaZ C-terminal domain-containing protein [Candidatus Hydrogenedentes bacterium]|nr:MaoC/PaaZ C-terminal domain-containing protein [Candidatus Hydrogenedentota bacterium]